MCKKKIILLLMGLLANGVFAQEMPEASTRVGVEVSQEAVTAEPKVVEAEVQKEVAPVVKEEKKEIKAVEKIAKKKVQVAQADDDMISFGDDTDSKEVKEEDDLSLADLMNLDIEVGNMTGLTGVKTPVALTVITKDDIKNTPHKNLLEIIQIYTPGAVVFSHITPQLGMRGIAIDRNYKWLLLVNGKLMNQRAGEGATVEIRNWDLSDVEQVEVIRGPGSVTYGPGAVAGVVNIITKKAAANPGLNVELSYVYPFDSKGGSASYGFVSENVNVYAYGSIRSTGGYVDYDYIKGDSKTGAQGLLEADQGKTNVIPLYGDMLDIPQIKAHVDVDFYKNWRWWTRYTQSGGGLWNSSTLANDGNIWALDGTNLAITPGVDDTVSARFSIVQSIATSLEGKHILNDYLTLKTTVGFDAENYHQPSIQSKDLPYNVGYRGKGGLEEEYYVDGEYVMKNGNTAYSLAEYEAYFKALANIKINERYKFALGASYSFETMTPAWGERAPEYASFFTEARKNADGGLIFNQMKYGLGAYVASVFGEANLGLHEHLILLLSGRLDRHTWSENFFSPRVGIISPINENNAIKLFWQKSLRMNTTTEMFIEYMNGEISKPEELMSYELGYSGKINNLSFNANGYYNNVEILGWSSADNKTTALGELTYAGAEIEAKYSTKTFDVGANHAVNKELEWKNGEGVTQQGISYADYNVVLDKTTGAALTSVGKDLNNYPTHISKVFGNYRLLPMGLDFHADVEVMWNHQGIKDGLIMYDNYYGKTDSAWTEARKYLDGIDYGGMEVKLNTSILYKLPITGVDLSLQIFGNNLIETNMYTLSSGNKSKYPDKIEAHPEPRTFGANIYLKL